MVVDLRLKQDTDAASKKRAAKNRNPQNLKRRKIAKTEDEEDNGFHFVAYVPAKGCVWKMDGMETFPRKLGKYVHCYLVLLG